MLDSIHKLCDAKALTTLLVHHLLAPEGSEKSDMSNQQRPHGSGAQTIGDLVLDEVRELHTMLTFLRDEGPDAFFGSLEKLGVLQDLSQAQQRRLSALVTEFYAQGDSVRHIARLKRDRRIWATHGSRRIQTLKRRMATARRAIEGVRTHVARIGVTPGKRVDVALAQALAVLDPARLHDVAVVVASLNVPEPSENAMVALYTFFASACGLNRKTAEVRVGQIGNYFWNWNVEVVTHSNSRAEKWEGCRAVSKAVARHRKHSLDAPRRSR